MTQQTLFNKVARHLLKQGRKSLNIYGECKYKEPDGSQCAVGCLISKVNYRIGMEGKNAIELYDTGLLPAHLHEHTDLLQKLQIIHDNYEPCLWQTQLEGLASVFNLKMPKL